MGGFSLRAFGCIPMLSRFGIHTFREFVCFIQEVTGGTVTISTLSDGKTLG